MRPVDYAGHVPEPEPEPIDALRAAIHQERRFRTRWWRIPRWLWWLFAADAFVFFGALTWALIHP